MSFQFWPLLSADDILHKRCLNMTIEYYTEKSLDGEFIPNQDKNKTWIGPGHS